jgi:hypothetical protein
MNWLQIVTSLLPLVNDLEPLVVSLINTIKGQGSHTDAELFVAASAQLDENEKALLQDIIARGGQAS